MKIYYKSLFFSLIIIYVFLSCTNKAISKKYRLYNGIDSQILNIVDSMSISKDMPFITVWFTMCNDSDCDCDCDCVVRFLNTLLIPAPDPPPALVKNKMISEDSDFKGYKKYDSIYLIFLESNPNGKFDAFVKKDSLNFDEKPFIEFNIYEFDYRHGENKTIEKKYLN